MCSLDFNSLNQFESVYLKAKADYDKEYSLWKERAITLCELLAEEEYTYIEEKGGKRKLINHFGYMYSDIVEIEVNIDFVYIEVLDFENSLMGKAKFKTEDFVHPKYKEIIMGNLKNLIENKKLEEEKSIMKKEKAELKRLIKKYGINPK